MAYKKQNFVDNETVLDAEHLEHIEDGIVANEEAIRQRAKQEHTHKKSEITDFPTKMEPTSHNHKKEDISDFPTSMAPTAHSQGANTITAGTFAGQVIANASGQSPSVSCVRNSKLVSAETNPTIEGEFCWTYE